MSEENFKKFAKEWSTYDPNATLMIPATQLKELLQNVDVPIGFGKHYEATEDQLDKRIEDLDIEVIPPTNDEGYKVHFSEVAKKLAKGVLEGLHLFEEVDKDHEINKQMNRKYKKAPKGVSSRGLNSASIGFKAARPFSASKKAAAAGAKPAAALSSDSEPAPAVSPSA